MSKAPVARRHHPEDSRWQEPLHVLALSTLVLAQPLFDLLARTPDFFVARDLRALDIVGLTLALWLAPPFLVLGVAEAAGRWLGRRARSLVYRAALGCLAALLFLLVARRLGLQEPVWSLSLALLFAVALSWCWRHWPALRQLLTMLAALAWLPPVWFLWASPLNHLIEEASAPSASAPAASMDLPVPPVVLVVLDELPASSLVRLDGRVDASLFPHLARLESAAISFPDSAAAATNTVAALPAILTARYPRPGLLATAKDHPHSLFALMKSSHRALALEPRTRLCPEALCQRTRDSDRAAVLADLAIVYLHLVLPRPLTTHLPDVTTNWNQFSGLTSKADEIDRFLDSLDLAASSERPPFILMHLELPHHPWIYLPEGRWYYPGTEVFIDGLQQGMAPLSGRWTDDSWVTLQGLQRHLLQLAYTDRVVGELFRRLEEADLFDASLIVVTADHGISFQPGLLARSLEPGNVLDIASVPLWIKLPHQRSARVDSRPASAVDIAPTVAQVLGLDWPWPTDGLSLLDPVPDFERRRAIFPAPDAPFLLKRLPPPQDHGIVGVRHQMFPPSAGGTERLFRLIPEDPPGLDALLDQHAEPWIGVASHLQAELDGMARFLDLDPRRDPLPSRVTGWLKSSDERVTHRPLLALAVDGVVRAFSMPRVDKSAAGEFSFMVPTTTWRSGPVQLELFEVSSPGSPETESGRPLELLPLDLPTTLNFARKYQHGRLTELVSSADVTYPVDDRESGRVEDHVYRHRAFRVVFLATIQLPTAAPSATTLIAFADDELLLVDRNLRFDSRLGTHFRVEAARTLVEGRNLSFFVLDEAGRAYPLAYQQRLVSEEFEAF